MNLYREDPDSGVLRSAGDPPGILIVGIVDGKAGLAVSQKWQPPKLDGRDRVLLTEEGDVEASIFEESIPVDLADVVDGLADQRAAELLWALVASAAIEALPVMLRDGLFAEIRDVVDLVETTRTKLEQEGELRGWDLGG